MGIVLFGYLIRPSCWTCQHSGLWCDRTRFTEGTIYRIRTGRLLVKFMVDRMTERQRTMSAQEINQTLAEWE